METQTAFVWADRAVHLYAITTVDFDFTFIVEPRNAEHHNSFGFCDSFEDFHFGKYRIFQNVRCQGLDHFVNGLMELFFTWIFRDDLGHEIIHVLLNMFFHCHIASCLSLCGDKYKIGCYNLQIAVW